MEKLLMGIDLGTSSVKACIFKTDCTPVSIGSGRYPTYHPRPLYAEQDASEWWGATVGAIRQALAGAQGKGVVVGVSVSSQSPSLLPLDRSGTPLRRAIIWMDRRAAKETDYLAYERIGIERYKNILGANPDTYYLLAKLYWYQQNEPELYEKTHIVLQTNGYINYRLTGNFSIDVIHAISVQAMDVRTGKWSDEIATAVGIPFKSLLPPIFPCSQTIGQVTGQAAQETGLLEGTPVMAGATDTIAAFLGLGIAKTNEAADMTGTSSIVFLPSKKQLEDCGKLLLKPSPVNTFRSVLVAPASTTGASLSWFAENFCESEQRQALQEGCTVFQIMDRQAQTALPGCGGLIYFPYLSGERGPLWNSHARGMFIGMTLQTGRAEMIRAILEGTSFAVRHILEEGQKLGAQVDTVRAAGGGCKSDIWLKIKASVLNRPLLVLDDKGVDRAALGDALLAGQGIGLFTDVEGLVRDCIKIKRVVEPDPKWVRIYEQLYPYYRSFYDKLDSGLLDLESVVSHW